MGLQLTKAEVSLMIWVKFLYYIIKINFRRSMKTLMDELIRRNSTICTRNAHEISLGWNRKVYSIWCNFLCTVRVHPSSSSPLLWRIRWNFSMLGLGGKNWIKKFMLYLGNLIINIYDYNY